MSVMAPAFSIEVASLWSPVPVGLLSWYRLACTFLEAQPFSHPQHWCLAFPQLWQVRENVLTCQSSCNHLLAMTFLLDCCLLRVLGQLVCLWAPALGSLSTWACFTLHVLFQVLDSQFSSGSLSSTEVLSWCKSNTFFLPFETFVLSIMVRRAWLTVLLLSTWSPSFF